MFKTGIGMKQIRGVAALVQSEDVFFAATGMSGGTFLGGVDDTGSRAVAHSLVMSG